MNKGDTCEGGIFKDSLVAVIKAGEYTKEMRWYAWKSETNWEPSFCVWMYVCVVKECWIDWWGVHRVGIAYSRYETEIRRKHLTRKSVAKTY